LHAVDAISGVGIVLSVAHQFTTLLKHQAVSAKLIVPHFGDMNLIGDFMRGLIPFII
jgi:hypothetical protein